MGGGRQGSQRMLGPPSGVKDVAIIGSGIAGLSAAHLLRRAGHRVTIIEARDTFGMDADSIDAGGRHGRVDAPPRAFSTGYYPVLMAMYERAGIEIEPMDWSLCAFVDDGGSDGGSDVGSAERGDVIWHGRRWQQRSLLRHTIGFVLQRARSCRSWAELARVARLCYDAMAFGLRDVPRATRSAATMAVWEQRTFGEFIDAGGYSPAFVHGLLLPLLSMVCTCTFDAVRRYPCVPVLEYLRARSRQYHAKRGTAHTAARLAEGATVHVGARVEAITPGAARGRGGGRDSAGGRAAGARPTVRFCVPGSAAGVQEMAFDAVIVATQADSASRLVPGAPPAVRQALRSVVHERSSGALHTDARFLPPSQGDWLPMNLRVTPTYDSSSFTMLLRARKDQGKGWDKDEASASNVAPTLGAQGGALLQTWNHEAFGADAIDASHLVRTVHFIRPVLTLASKTQLEALWRGQGQGGVYYCGAYALFSVPLQESAAKSAVRVAELLGVECRWASEACEGARRQRELACSRASARWACAQSLLLAGMFAVARPLIA